MDQPDTPRDTEAGQADRKSVIEYVFFQSSQRISHEQAQAIARMCIGCVVSPLLAWYQLTRRVEVSGELLAIWLIYGYTLFSFVYFAFVLWLPNRFLWRRYVVMGTDLGIVSLGTYAFGTTGFAFYPLYLWVMIGNGLRYGLHHLRVTTVLGVTFYLAATLASGAWSRYPGVTLGLLLGLVIMPNILVAVVKRLEEANQQLQTNIIKAEHMATHDGLTGLPNRVLLEDLLRHALAASERQLSQGAVIFIDLDGFKVVNDSYGHQTGDRLLCMVADRLRAQVRGSDTVARLGGDEFIVLIEDCQGPGHVSIIHENLYRGAGGQYDLNGHITFVTWSSGAAMFPKDGLDAESLIKHADTAMYRAKEAGGHQLRFYDAQMSRQMAELQSVKEELQEALRRRSFVLHYQPQVDAISGAVVGAEALLRWRHPEKGLLGPGAFIEIAEQSGLILPLGAWALERACRELAQWQEAGFTGVRVSVNVSGKQLMHEGFLEELARIVRLTRVSPRGLGLEMTESVLIEEREQLSQVFAGIKRLGLTLSLDDFGTRYSSLSYLKRFPIDTLKIDQSFVRDIPDDISDGALVEAILGIGRSLGLKVIAEGVETGRQLEWLRSHDCRWVQGYLTGRPIPAEEFRALLERSAGGSEGTVTRFPGRGA